MFAGVEFAGVVAGLDVDIRLQPENFPIKPWGVKYKNRVHKPQCGERIGAILLGLHRTRRPFEGTNAGVAIERNKKGRILSRGVTRNLYGRKQTIEVPPMQQIKNPIGKHHRLALGA